MATMLHLLKAYGGTPLDLQALSAYDRWAIGYFADGSRIIDPNCEITVQLDITDAEASYRRHRAGAPGASLTAHLTWSLLQALGRHPCFSWRAIDGTWYAFDNLPLYLPVATGTPSRYQDVLIEGATRMGWEEFCRAYRAKVEEALRGEPFQAIPDEVFFHAWIIGNMRQLPFTSLRVFIARMRTGRPVFYFGKRYASEGRLRIPFYAMLDHSTAEPERLDALIGDYQRVLVGELGG